MQNQNITCFGSQNVRYGRIVSKSTLVIWSAFTATNQHDLKVTIDAARQDHEGKPKVEGNEEEEDAQEEDKAKKEEQLDPSRSSGSGEPAPKKLKPDDEWLGNAM